MKRSRTVKQPPTTKKSSSKGQTETGASKQPPQEYLDDSGDKAMSNYVRSIWKQYDEDNNGVLDTEEAKKFVREMMSELVTTHHAGAGGDEELGEPGDLDEEGFLQIFRMIDTDDSGTITKQEMFDYLRNICGISFQ